MKRSEIIISGDVQEAGYRAYVIKRAQKLKLVGFVENLPDGTVRVVCEGSEETIKRFSEVLKITTPTINVENIEIQFKDATGEFDGKGFKVKISDIAEELFQGYATAAKYFMIGFEKQDMMLEKQDKMANKLDETKNEIIEKLNNIHTDLVQTHKDFEKIDDRYSHFSSEMVDIKSEMREIKELFAKLVNHLTGHDKV